MIQCEQGVTPARGLVIAAFAALYVIWGANYLAIRYAVETIPHFFMGGARFLFAGLMLYVLLRITGTPAPLGLHWVHAAIAGALMLGIGNGGLNWSQQKVPSSVAALLIAVTPLWFSLLEWIRPKGTRPTLQTAAGLLIGFGGAALLATTRDNGQRSLVDPAGAAALMAASFSH
ncbi:MAG: EamA family transporter [Verrucomicrobia bacterium]|nr:EamA family transporter [Verrucomicrobiota bacterium]